MNRIVILACVLLLTGFRDGLCGQLPTGAEETARSGPLLASEAYGQFPLPSHTPRPSTSSLPQASTIHVDVNLVQVEASVRDKHGNSIAGLRRADFHLFEDGVEQEIRYFSHDELPLAIALVIDGSTSIAAVLHELREGALETLALLKPDDQVALFSFNETPKLVEPLTANRDLLDEDLAEINPWGGTNINDALYAAADYLGREARGRRRAVILVSDNEPSERSTHDNAEVIRTALDAETVVDSIKFGFYEHSKWYLHSNPDLGWVQEICRATGGEVIDSRVSGSIASALRTVLSRLQEGYTLGYVSSNQLQDGTYRRIELRLSPRFGKPGSAYTIYARPGYYTPQSGRP